MKAVLVGERPLARSEARSPALDVAREPQSRLSPNGRRRGGGAKRTKARRESTIARFIERFRSEPARSPGERLLSRDNSEQLFWWTGNGSKSEWKGSKPNNFDESDGDESHVAALIDKYSENEAMNEIEELDRQAEEILAKYKEMAKLKPEYVLEGLENDTLEYSLLSSSFVDDLEVIEEESRQRTKSSELLGLNFIEKSNQETSKNDASDVHVYVHVVSGNVVDPAKKPKLIPPSELCRQVESPAVVQEVSQTLAAVVDRIVENEENKRDEENHLDVHESERCQMEDIALSPMRQEKSPAKEVSESAVSPLRLEMKEAATEIRAIGTAEAATDALDVETKDVAIGGCISTPIQLDADPIFMLLQKRRQELLKKLGNLDAEIQSFEESLEMTASISAS